MSTNIDFTRSNAVIASGATTSGVIQCLAVPATLYLPTNFTGSDITFLTADDENSAYTNPLKDNTGAVVTVIAAAALDPISLDPGIFSGIQFFKIKTSAAQTDPNPVIIKVIFTPIYGNYLS
jgi:hypothetical protein